MIMNDTIEYLDTGWYRAESDGTHTRIADAPTPYEALEDMIYRELDTYWVSYPRDLSERLNIPDPVVRAVLGNMKRAGKVTFSIAWCEDRGCPIGSGYLRNET